jgi:DNA-directed RNA polymerase subunit beta
VEGEFMMVDRELIELMDISPNQLVSVSASLIPFWKTTTPTGLMGSNMQRQAVPLMINEAPGGYRHRRGGGQGFRRNHRGRRDGRGGGCGCLPHRFRHDPTRAAEKPVTIYNLSKFIRSNQNTCFNHRPSCKKGQTG